MKIYEKETVLSILIQKIIIQTFPQWQYKTVQYVFHLFVRQMREKMFKYMRENACTFFLTSRLWG